MLSSQIATLFFPSRDTRDVSFPYHLDHPTTTIPLVRSFSRKQRARYLKGTFSSSLGASSGRKSVRRNVANRPILPPLLLSSFDLFFSFFLFLSTSVAKSTREARVCVSRRFSSFDKMKKIHSGESEERRTNGGLLFQQGARGARKSSPLSGYECCLIALREVPREHRQHHRNHRRRSQRICIAADRAHLFRVSPAMFLESDQITRCSITGFTLSSTRNVNQSSLYLLHSFFFFKFEDVTVSSNEDQTKHYLIFYPYYWYLVNDNLEG